MKNKTLLIAALVAVGCGGAALAEKPEGDKPKRPGGPAGLVKRLDTDKNGELSVEELSKMKEEGRAKLLKRADKNADGALDKSEIATMKASAPKPGKKKEEGAEGTEKKKKDGAEGVEKKKKKKQDGE